MDDSLRTPEVGEKGKVAELLEKVQGTSIEVYKVLSPSNLSEAKEAFLADDSMIVPPFEYGKIDADKIRQNIIALQEVYDEAKEADFSREDELAVGILTDASAASNAFVQDCIDYNAATTPEERQRVAEAHKFSDETLYGKPDEAVFYALLKSEMGKIKVDALSAEDREMHEALVAEIGEVKESDVEPYRPSQETVEKFSEVVHTLYDGLLKHIPEGKDEFTTQEAAEIVKEIISTEFSDEPVDDPSSIMSYHVVMKDNTDTCSVSQETREIVFPVKRAKGNFDAESLKKIIVHEFGTHAYRGAVYEGDELEALSREMPNNEEIDEGIAKCCEQAIAGKYSVSGVEHYINIGLANFKGKNFREIFEIQRKLLYLKGCKAGKTETPEEKAARFHSKDNAVFSRTMRCFRGTGELPNNKDLVYYNGADRVWRFIEENIDDPELPDKLFLSGKTNIFDREQERLVYEKKVKAEGNGAEG